MLQIITERIRQGYHTVKYPARTPTLPPRFLGRPELFMPTRQLGGVEAFRLAVAQCPSGALSLAGRIPTLDTGRCIFCGVCARLCPDVVRFTRDYRLGAATREELVIRAVPGRIAPPAAGVEAFAPSPDELTALEEENLIAQDPMAEEREGVRDAEAEHAADARMFRRSFRIRQVSAAGCNACEADCNVLGTIVFDLARFGIDFVASPRHADALLITGPVPRNMQRALMKCHAAMPAPKLVLAVGACAISGGLFREMDQNGRGVGEHLPVDYYIPGCPPHPYTTLDGMLHLLGRL